MYLRPALKIFLFLVTLILKSHEGGREGLYFLYRRYKSHEGGRENLYFLYRRYKKHLERRIFLVILNCFSYIQVLSVLTCNFCCCKSSKSQQLFFQGMREGYQKQFFLRPALVCDCKINGNNLNAILYQFLSKNIKIIHKKLGEFIQEGENKVHFKNQGCELIT